MTSWIDPFLEGLRERGYIEGQTIEIVWRFTPGGTDTQFADLAADLVRLRVDLIAARTISAAIAAKQSTGTIPIVSLGASNILENGLVASLAQQGGNLTGTTVTTVGGTTGKKMELLREVVSRTEVRCRSGRCHKSVI